MKLIYFGFFSRGVLDFDFEKLCSVSLSRINVYACLVCGKYFQVLNFSDSLFVCCRQGCGSGSLSGLDPDSMTLWIRSQNPDPGSRGNKMKKDMFRTGTGTSQ
jgi:hypothetical protein